MQYIVQGRPTKRIEFCKKIGVGLGRLNRGRPAKFSFGFGRLCLAEADPALLTSAPTLDGGHFFETVIFFLNTVIVGGFINYLNT